MSTLRDILNRTRWRDEGLHALQIDVLHRGAPGDRRVIAGSRVVAVRSGGIELAAESEGADPVFVPYHRFLAIRGPEGEPLWTKEHGEAATALAAPEPAGHAPSELAGEEVLADFTVVLRGASGDGPLVLDGSAGEGGGQILRTALTLSMATATPFVLEKIRAGRKKPGLMRQHLTCVKAAAAICDADVEGATLGSTRLVFRPKAVTAGEHAVDIGSAGAVALVLQTVALPLAMAEGPSRITVRGGTHALWAPPFPFLAEAWLPLVRRAGAALDLDLRNPGFYPAGGGEVVMSTAGAATMAPLHLGEQRAVGVLELRAIVAQLPEGIARRELAAAAELLTGHRLSSASETVRSEGPGNALWLVARDEGTGVTNVFSGIGDVGVRAEQIGEDVARAFLAWQASGASVEEHLADQVMLPIALAGAGSYTTNVLSLHARTNIEVIAAFTGRRLRAYRLAGERFRVEL